MTFSAAEARGAMSGYGWVAMGEKDIVTSPTCGPSHAPITPSASCSFASTNWGSTSALCVSATIPALSSAPTATEYTENWGIRFGVNASASDPLSPIGEAFSSITFNLTGSPQTGLRAFVHRAGDTPGVSYCALVTSGKPIVLTSFNTSCWNGTGTSLTAADAPKIDKIGLEVTSTLSEINVNNLCITSIVFGN